MEIGGGSGSGSADGDAMTASVGNDEPAVYSGGGSGSGGSSSDGSVPRVIVTGFDTNPAEVHAGSDFTLTIHLKNTSGILMRISPILSDAARVMPSILKKNS